MNRLIRIILAIWVLLVYMLIVAVFGKGFSQLVELALLIIFTLTTAFVLTLLVTLGG